MTAAMHAGGLVTLALVTALALGEWVTRRVPQLAREKGHQQNAVFRAAQRELRSFPIAVVQR